MRSSSRASTSNLALPSSGARGTQGRRLAGVRWVLLVAALLLAAIGLATVHSASSELTHDYLPRQLLWVGLGLVLVALTVSLDYHVLMDLSPALYGLGLVALVLVLFFGDVRGGARSWLGWGGLGGQPSEMMKLATTLLLARYFALSNQRYLTLRQITVGLVLVAVPMVLIAREPDLGGALLYMPIFAGMTLVAGMRLKTFFGLAAIGLVVGALVFTLGMKDYQRQRVFTYFTPSADPQGAGYQVRQSKIAVGSGQLTGRGYMQGTQSQLRFLPERHTDFVFAVVAEEWGFLGVITVLGLYSLFFVNATVVAMRARDRAGILMVAGLLSMLAFHVLYNTAMVVGLVPITGIPLPFISYGGSFTLLNFLATGLILGVDLRRHVNR